MTDLANRRSGSRRPPPSDGEQSTPADFGTVDFSQTEIYGDFGSSGTSWYSTDMDADNEIAMVNEPAP